MSFLKAMTPRRNNTGAAVPGGRQVGAPKSARSVPAAVRSGSPLAAEAISQPSAVDNISLEQFLEQAVARDGEKQNLAELILAIASGAIELAGIISLGQIAGSLHAPVASESELSGPQTLHQDHRGQQRDGHKGTRKDVQKHLDLLANEIFLRAIPSSMTAAVLSEELERPVDLSPAAPLAVAIDPLDGSSNIESNVSLGTIFSIFPAAQSAAKADNHFLRPGREQLAAGFVIYGPHTSLVLTLGDGVQVFTLHRSTAAFHLAIPKLNVPHESHEFAVNSSNYRHWNDPMRAYIDDCLMGAEGPLCRDHNMRWIASLVAEAYRILVRGGVFLYPADRRHGYSSGWLRLIYEANPISFLIEQAGGKATSCVNRILDIQPKELHARTPFVFGSHEVVERISRYHTDPHFSVERSPIFARRGLIRR
ncbi:MAG TPA: class 1 fructose-bisphosphatase [Candidatus Sulfotelmatobacter sp.]|jgi:fructose-1,6-bisphosphatase I